MKRPWTYTLAAVLNVLYCLIGLAFETPNLIMGAVASETQYGGEGPPFVLTLLNFALAIIGLVATYGVWNMQKWGIVLAIAVTALSILPKLPALVFAPPPLNLVGAVGVVWAVAIIVLLLRPGTKALPITGDSF